MRRILFLIILLVMAGCTERVPMTFRNTDITGAKFGHSLNNLRDHHEKPVDLSDFHGKAVLLFFGYTSCPDICPTTLVTLSESLSSLTADERKKVAVLFVSVDPERDTVAHLKTYLDFFSIGAVGLTGTAEQIADVARRYGVFYSKQAADSATGAYSMDHSADTFLVGPEGRVRARIAHGTQPEEVVAIIRQYLNPQ